MWKNMQTKFYAYNNSTFPNKYSQMNEKGRQKHVQLFTLAFPVQWKL